MENIEQFDITVEELDSRYAHSHRAKLIRQTPHRQVLEFFEFGNSPKEALELLRLKVRASCHVDTPAKRDAMLCVIDEKLRGLAARESVGAAR